ncbi:uncharacterized protein V5649_010680 [Rhynchonycteris naso]
MGTADPPSPRCPRPSSAASLPPRRSPGAGQQRPPGLGPRSSSRPLARRPEARLGGSPNLGGGALSVTSGLMKSCDDLSVGNLGRRKEESCSSTKSRSSSFVSARFHHFPQGSWEQILQVVCPAPASSPNAHFHLK